MSVGSARIADCAAQGRDRRHSMPRTQPSPVWPSLTSVLDVPDSAPRRLLAEAFPLTRAVQADYRARVGPIRVPGGSANPGTLGSAFDIWVDLQATLRPTLPVAVQGSRRAGPVLAAAYEELLDRLGPRSAASPELMWSQERARVSKPWTGPSAEIGERDLLRLSWASALLVEAYRLGGVIPGSPLAGLPDKGPVDLLALAPAAALDELAALAALADLARVDLLPRLRALSQEGATWLSPVFIGSLKMSADADLVTGHTLVEIKTVLGAKSPSGRKVSLDGLTLFQLLGYVLHDHDDAYGITNIGLYQGRYGVLVFWSLDRLLRDLAGHDVDLPALRRRWALMLETGDVPRL